MKIQKNKFASKNIIILVPLLGLLLIAGGVFAAYLLNNTQDDSSDVVGKPGESDKRQAKELASNPDNKATQVNTDTPPSVSTEAGEDKATIGMVVSANVSDGKVYIRGGLNSAIVDGRCYAKVSGPNGKLITKETTLLQNASTTDCKTVIIDSSELTPGKWVAVLSYSSNDIEGSSSEASFEIK